MMKIIVSIKQIYGKSLIYPENEPAKLFTQISRRKTLDRQDVEVIKQLGFEVEIKQETL